MIKKYLQKLKHTLKKYDHIVEDYSTNEQIFTEEKGTIDGKVHFNDKSRMDFLEIVNTRKKTKEKYSYHYMNKDKEIQFRYDNAKHYRNMKTFPHHKHTKNGIIESEETNINEVLSEIENHISDNIN